MKPVIGIARPKTLILILENLFRQKKPKTTTISNRNMMNMANSLNIIMKRMLILNWTAKHHGSMIKEMKQLNKTGSGTTKTIMAMKLKSTPSS